MGERLQNTDYNKERKQVCKLKKKKIEMKAEKWKRKRGKKAEQKEKNNNL